MLHLIRAYPLYGLAFCTFCIVLEPFSAYASPPDADDACVAVRTHSTASRLNRTAFLRLQHANHSSIPHYAVEDAGNVLPDLQFDQLCEGWFCGSALDALRLAPNGRAPPMA
jgi:hypothetical protein